MINEKNQILDACLRLLAAIIFAILYCIGGAGLLFMRRYVAPVELVLAMLYFSGWNWRQFPALAGIGALCLGYSADSLIGGIIRRGLFGMANGLAFSIPNLLSKRFLLAGFQMILVPASCIAFGIWNPFSNARIEELVIGFEIAFIPVMSARPKA